MFLRLLKCVAGGKEQEIKNKNPINMPDLSSLCILTDKICIHFARKHGACVTLGSFDEVKCFKFMCREFWNVIPLLLSINLTIIYNLY